VGTYSAIAAVDEAFSRFVREQDLAAPPYPPLVSVEEAKARVAAVEPEARVHETVHATVEHSHLALAIKVSRLVPGPVYTQLDVWLSRFGPLAHLAWETVAKPRAEPVFGPTAPNERVGRVEVAVRGWLEAAGVRVVPFEEARRLVVVADDPFYPGESYDMTVFEALFGMGYPEKQR
jgi:hypothetical protein